MKPFTFVALGDSLTFGYGVNKTIAYPSRLAKDFPQWEIINTGINGETTREALQRMDSDVLSHGPQMVGILYGSNDSSLLEGQYRHLGEYKKNLLEILQRILDTPQNSDFNHGKVLPVLITPPPCVDTDFFPFTTTDRVEAYATVMKQIGVDLNLPVIDFFSAMYAKKEESFTELFQSDGLHLSHLGYDVLYQLVHDTFAKLTGEA